MPKPLTEKTRSRLYSCVLYPEDENQRYAIELLKGGSFSAVGVLHDKDISIDEVTGEPTEFNEDGTPKLKKPHYHFVLRFKNARYAGSLAKELKINLNYMEKSSDFPSAVRYIVHKGYPDKHQYDVSELVGSLTSAAIEAMDDCTESERALELLKLIADQPNILTATQLIRLAAEEGRWSDLRRGGAWFMQAMQDHNNEIVQEHEVYTRDYLNPKY